MKNLFKTFLSLFLAIIMMIIKVGATVVEPVFENDSLPMETEFSAKLLTQLKNYLSSKGELHDGMDYNGDEKVNIADLTYLKYALAGYEGFELKNRPPLLVDIGEAHFKDITSIHDVDYDDNGDTFARNQILLTANDDVDFEMVEKLVKNMNAEIVGFIELVNDYQIEFKENVSADTLNLLIDDLMDNPIVEFASLNIAFEVEEDSHIAPGNPMRNEQ